MAEASVPGSVHVSDEVIEFPCSLCQNDGVVEEGIVYCTNCHDYLCRACLKVHRRIRSTKDHKLLEGSRIREAVKYGLKTVPEICEKHKDKCLEYFCLSHSELICEDCKEFNHRRCRDVKSIDDVSQGLHGSQQALRFLDDTKALIRDLKALQQTRAGNLRQVEQQKKTCLEEVKSLRLELNSLLDRLENEMQQEIARVSEGEANSLNKKLATLATAVKKLEKDAVSLEDVSTSGGDRQVFIIIHKTGLEKMKELYEDLHHIPDHGSLVFHMDEKIKDLLGNLTAIGTLRVATVPSQISPGTTAERGEVPSSREIREKLREKVGTSSELEETSMPLRLPQTPSEKEHSPACHVIPGTTAEGGEVATGRGTREKPGEKVDTSSNITETPISLPRTVRVIGKGNTPTCHVIPGSFSGRKLVKTGTHCVRDKKLSFGGDTEECCITGAKFLQDGRCILCA